MSFSIRALFSYADIHCYVAVLTFIEGYFKGIASLFRPFSDPLLLFHYFSMYLVNKDCGHPDISKRRKKKMDHLVGVGVSFFLTEKFHNETEIFHYKQFLIGNAQFTPQFCFPLFPQLKL